jgi:choline dehydrogenase
MPELGLSHFDYVVVGGGTSGLLVANRLSQDPGVTVAIIDPGSDQRLNPTIRASAPLEPLLTSKVTNWKYKSSPQEGANGRQLDLYAGKGLGGSSLINGIS